MRQKYITGHRVSKCQITKNSCQSIKYRTYKNSDGHRVTERFQFSDCHAGINQYNRNMSLCDIEKDVLEKRKFKINKSI